MLKKRIILERHTKRMKMAKTNIHTLAHRVHMRTHVHTPAHMRRH
jgi:hypothetical protein